MIFLNTSWRNKTLIIRRFSPSRTRIAGIRTGFTFSTIFRGDTTILYRPILWYCNCRLNRGVFLSTITTYTYRSFRYGRMIQSLLSWIVIIIYTLSKSFRVIHNHIYKFYNRFSSFVVYLKRSAICGVPKKDTFIKFRIPLLMVFLIIRNMTFAAQNMKIFDIWFVAFP